MDRLSIDCFLGLDIGTTGVRAILIDVEGHILATSSASLPASISERKMVCQQPDDWWSAVQICLQQLAARHNMAGLQAISIDGTSGTTLLTDSQNRPVSPALMYNDVRPPGRVQNLCEKSPDIPACSRTSALSKAVWLSQHYTPAGEFFIQQQADWVLSQFTGKPGASDWNNALKIGFDLDTLTWPDWLSDLNLSRGHFPRVFRPGRSVAEISPQIASQLGIPATTRLHAGTTDSIAAYHASGAIQPGDAVTSLGSTLVLKLCTNSPINSIAEGIYSHRIDKQRWLVGGASNSGGAVLKENFTHEELLSLSKQINPAQNTGLNYYPLPSKGERFPYPDAEKQPNMLPVPENRSEYLQAIFEGMAQIEKQGYSLFEKLGTVKVKSIRSSGGGAKNEAWTKIRERIISRPLIKATHTEAAYGSALLAAGKV